ncbi:hypothetical protein LO763_22830 [Glycomyces sp. A-F 0318]|uniref:glycine-rich domain-containing protein n=1 Tax=Glycomyces amatae TaxID=2881355 RepID=UPI001E4CE9B5|nr:hypothetical protein [Glycomyces amatae]MCD0446455.1 hypothetical protein [Glycomyces amatae]
MNLTAVFSPADAAVTVTATGLTDHGTGHVRIERHADNQASWTPVRGATVLAVPADGTLTVIDREYTPGRINRYRVVAAVWRDQVTPSADPTWGESWQVPAGITSATVECTGPGGSAAPGMVAAAGGGGGAVASSTVPLVPGDTVNIVVGRAGAAGQTGNSSAFLHSGEQVVLAAPGESVTDPGRPGAGGSGIFPQSIGDRTAQGGPGGLRESAAGAGGGGGAPGTATGHGGPGGSGTAGTGGPGGRAAWPVAAAARSVTTAATAHVADAVTATGPGLLLAAWISWERTGVYTLPTSMTAMRNQSGTWATFAAAVESVTAAGSTGTRTATVPTADRYTSASVFVHGANVQVGLAAHTLATSAPATVTLADVTAGTWLVAVTAHDDGDAVALDTAPSGGPWYQLTATAVSAATSRIAVWARQVTAAGPQTVTVAADTATDNFLSVFTMTGVTSFGPVQGAAGGATGAAGQHGSVPGAGGGGQGAGGTAGLGGHGRVLVRSWEIATGPVTTEVAAPAVAAVWLKWPRYPSLNRTVHIADISETTRAPRKGLFDVAGRSVPVVVADVHASRAFTVTFRLASMAEADALETVLTHAGTVLVETPPGSNLPSGWVEPLEVRQVGRGPAEASRLLQVACRIAAAPDPAITAAEPSWAAIAHQWGTWADAGPLTWPELAAATVTVADSLVVP